MILKAKIVQPEPYPQNLDPSRQYAWCSCGHSTSHPFCDGSHIGSDFEPVIFTPKNKHMIWVCGCGHSKQPPYCDGRHNKLDQILGNKKPVKNGFFKRVFKRG